MKTKVPVRKQTVHAMPVLVIVCMLLIVSFSSSATGCPASPRSDTSNNILVQKQVTSKKYKIRLYPNATQEVLFFSASGDEGKVFQLFLFDVDGKLVKQVNIRNKQTTALNNIEKGNYLFEVFSDDERIEAGQVIVR